MVNNFFNLNFYSLKPNINANKISAEKEADNVIREFLQNTEEQRQTQTQLLELEKREEIELLSRSHCKQSLHRAKDTICKLYLYTLFQLQHN